MRVTVRSAILIGTLLAPAVANGQSGEPAQALILDDLRQLRAQLEAATSELQQLRREVDQLKAGTAAPPPAQVDLSALVEVLQSQVAEQAQAKVESDSRFPVTIFGTVHSVLAFNSGEANWLESPNIVGPDRTPSGSIAWTARQTRLGLRADGLPLGTWRGSAATAFDFFGGVPAFQTGQVMGLPRLVYAYARLERGAQAIEIGQDAMILAPRNPTLTAAYSFPLLYRSGNLYLRLPQARIETRLVGHDGAELRATAGIVAPVAGDFSSSGYVFVPSAFAGERSWTPGVQARLAWQQGAGTRAMSFAVSGHYSRERQTEEFGESWAGAFDFDIARARFGFTGEGFVGQNIDAFGGAIGQPADAAGGFLEGRFYATRRWDLVAGAGLDAADGVVSLSRNTSAYGSLNFHPSPEVTTSVEYRWLTTVADGGSRANHYVSWAMSYGF